MGLGDNMTRTGSRRLGAIIALAALLALAGCDSGPSWHGKDGKSGKADPNAPSATITAPGDGATDVPASAEITFTTAMANSSKVELADADGKAVEGAMRPDGSSWMPNSQLKYGTKYTVKVTATGKEGRTGVRNATFTTMSKPGNLVAVRSQIGDDIVYGVGMPVVINFGGDIPKDKRADVERRLFVTSEPAQEGAWNWFNAHEIHFRAREYWQPNTKLSVRLATGGLPLGGDMYGAGDVDVHASIGDKFVMSVDNASKTMTVTKNDQVVNSIPVSLGKPSAPSSSGNMIVMVKNEWEWFDSSTYGVPVDAGEGYRTKVNWPMRLTWGGQYIHAAPWSVADQGHTNVSHGCTNVSMQAADWLWHQVHLGDPVIVKGTERGLDWGDGWTDWNVSFDQYKKGSALPAAAASPTPAPSPS